MSADQDRVILITSFVADTDMQMTTRIVIHADPTKLPTITFEASVQVDTEVKLFGWGGSADVRIIDVEKSN